MNWIGSWWQQVSATVAQGLGITVVGMALVFVTLGLIILSLILLTRLPGLRAREESKKSEPEENTPPPAKASRLALGVTAGKTAAGAGDDERAQLEELAQVAAIAVALIHSRRVSRRQIGRRAATSRWKQYGRAHQLGL